MLNGLQKMHCVSEGYVPALSSCSRKKTFAAKSEMLQPVRAGCT